MKTPITCPKCHGPLLSTELPLRNKISVWKKTCTNKVNHHFTCVTEKGNDNSIGMIIVGLSYDNQLQAYWYLKQHMLVVYKGQPIKNADGLNMPWVEPDLSQYDKLIEKIKTYITFS